MTALVAFALSGLWTLLIWAALKNQHRRHNPFDQQGNQRFDAADKS